MAVSSPQAEAPLSGRAARTRQRILDAAGQCFAAGGYAKTTVEEIATRAGVSKALVYRHFHSKEEILDAVLAHTLEAWAEASHEEALAEGASVLEALSTMHRSALAWARENPVLRALVTMDESVLLTVGELTVRRELERFRRVVQGAVERGVASGELRSDLDPARIGDMIRLLHMALIEQVLAPRWVEAPDDALIEASLEVLFHGIARRPS